MVARVGVPVVYLSREVPPEPPPKRSFPEGLGKRIVFQSDSCEVQQVVLPIRSLQRRTRYSPSVSLSGLRLVAFGSHVRRTLPEGMRSAALVSGGVSRPRQPVSRLPVISSRSIPSFEISSFHAYATAVADDRFLSVSVVVGEQALQRWPCFHLRWCRRCRPAEFLELVI